MSANPFRHYPISFDIAEQALQFHEAIKSQNKRTTWKRTYFHGFCIHKAYESQSIVKTIREISMIVAEPNVGGMESFIRKKSRPAVSGIYIPVTRWNLRDLVRSHCNTLQSSSSIELLMAFMNDFEGKIDFGNANMNFVAAGVIVAYYVMYYGMSYRDYVANSLNISPKTVGVHADSIITHFINQGFKFSNAIPSLQTPVDTTPVPYQGVGCA